MAYVCKYCGLVIRVEYGHTMRHGNVTGECVGSNIMVTPTYTKG